MLSYYMSDIMMSDVRSKNPKISHLKISHQNLMVVLPAVFTSSHTEQRS